MNRAYNTRSALSYFRPDSGAARIFAIWLLSVLLFLPGAALNAAVLKGLPGGGPEEGKVTYYNGKEWVEAPLVKETPKTDTLVTAQPLFYFNGIVWVDAGMKEDDVDGKTVKVVNLPLKQMAEEAKKLAYNPAKRPQHNEAVKEASMKKQQEAQFEVNIDNPLTAGKVNNNAPSGLTGINNNNVLTVPVLEFTPGTLMDAKKDDKKPFTEPVKSVVSTPVKPEVKPAPAPVKLDKPVETPVKTNSSVTTGNITTNKADLKLPEMAGLKTADVKMTPKPEPVENPVIAPVKTNSSVTVNKVSTTKPDLKSTETIGLMAPDVKMVVKNTETTVAPPTVTKTAAPDVTTSYDKVVKKTIVVPVDPGPNGRPGALTETATKTVIVAKPVADQPVRKSMINASYISPTIAALNTKSLLAPDNSSELMSKTIDAPVTEYPFSNDVIETPSPESIAKSISKTPVLGAMDNVAKTAVLSNESVVKKTAAETISAPVTELAPKIVVKTVPANSSISKSVAILSIPVLENLGKMELVNHGIPLTKSYSNPVSKVVDNTTLKVAENSPLSKSIAVLSLPVIANSSKEIKDNSTVLPTKSYSNPMPKVAPSNTLKVPENSALSKSVAILSLPVLENSSKNVAGNATVFPTKSYSYPMPKVAPKNNSDTEAKNQTLTKAFSKMIGFPPTGVKSIVDSSESAPTPQEAQDKDKKKKKGQETSQQPTTSINDSIREYIKTEVAKLMIKNDSTAQSTKPAEISQALIDSLVKAKTDTADLTQLKAQLEQEIAEQLKLREDIQAQVDLQRQKKKEAKLSGEMGKLDTIKLKGDDYVVTEEKFALMKEVFGWHPHWMGNAYRTYDYTLLSTVAYFSYEVNPVTGGYYTVHDWRSTDMIEMAQAKGCKAVLTASLLNGRDLSLFLASKKAQEKFTTTIRDLVVERNGNGVNINFENLNPAYRTEFVKFIKNLRKSFDEISPSYQISITLPAVDANEAYDVEDLAEYVDLMIMMGYEYSGSHSGPGPTSPLGDSKSYGASLSASVDSWLKRKAPAEKFLLALPYYGVSWEVEGRTVPGKPIRFLKSLSYSEIQNKYGSTEPMFWTASMTPYYTKALSNNSYEQVWFDNARSLNMKCDLVLDKKIGGIGIWSLGMDKGHQEFWNVIEDKFLQLTPVAIDTIQLQAKGSSSSGIGSWLKSKSSRFISILRRPSTFDPNSSSMDNWLRNLVYIGGFTFIISRIVYVIRRLQMGEKWKGKNAYMYVMATSIGVFLICLLMYARVTSFFTSVASSRGFQFSIGLIIGIIVCILFVFYVLPKLLKNKHLP